MHFDNKKVIIFDLDGTLIDSVPDLALSVNKMLQELGRVSFSEDTIRYWVGNGASVLVKRALLGKVETDEDVDAALFDKALAIFLDYYAHHLSDTTQLYPDVETTLHKLQDQGYILTIVTNKPFAFVEPILKGLNIAHLFELWLGGDSLEVKKPDPTPLLHVCQTFNISPNEALMVGDSKNDIVAANRAKIESIGVTYGYNYGEPIESYEPSAVVDSFGDILKLMERV
ncbi:MAG: phosphoglycolate phosphatase [Campylobacterales bacterium]|nr:phosphoglycolate phosphatase [Campylobacterales bacterium]